MKTMTGKVWLGIGFISFSLGILLLILAAVSGYRMRRGDTYSFKEGYEQEIRSLDFKIEYGHVQFLEGEEFRIDADGLYEGGAFESIVRDGVWTIREKSKTKVDIFGMHLPAISLFGGILEQDIRITLPKDFIAEDIHLELGAARLEVGSLRSKTGSFTIGAGEAYFNQLEITEHSTYDVGAGYMEIRRANIKNISVDCGVGYFSLEGTVTGENEVTCGVGRVRMDMEGDIEGYSYQADTGIGNVTVNGKSHLGSLKRNSQKEFLGSFDLECGIGNITMLIY